jgi:hypothetical protein
MLSRVSTPPARTLRGLSRPGGGAGSRLGRDPTTPTDPAGGPPPHFPHLFRCSVESGVPGPGPPGAPQALPHAAAACRCRTPADSPRLALAAESNRARGPRAPRCERRALEADEARGLRRPEPVGRLDTFRFGPKTRGPRPTPAHPTRSCRLRIPNPEGGSIGPADEGHGDERSAQARGRPLSRTSGAGLSRASPKTPPGRSSTAARGRGPAAAALRARRSPGEVLPSPGPMPSPRPPRPSPGPTALHCP